MIRALLAAVAALCSISLSTADLPARPKIYGIAYVRLYVTDMDKSSAFYGKILGLPSSDCRAAGVSRSCFAISWFPRHQHVELEPVPSPAPKNWLSEIAFVTDDVSQMRRYLIAHGVTTGATSKDAYGIQRFEMRDPEGNALAFVQRSELPVDDPPPSNPVGDRLLHAGFVVKDLALMKKFYMDLLGFRLYWHGSFPSADRPASSTEPDDWFEIQVPDGDNWVEFMLNISPTADHRDLGVQNHFSLGVKDANAAATQLRANGATKFDGPEVGRDGKNSLDIYDPDLTRVEVMDFTPTNSPCCHPYAADHPKL